jgi:hypothetical protein
MVKTYNRLISFPYVTSDNVNDVNDINNVNDITTMKRFIDMKDGAKGVNNVNENIKKNEKNEKNEDAKPISYDCIDARINRLEMQINYMQNCYNELSAITKDHSIKIIDTDKKLTGHIMNTEMLQKRLNIKPSNNLSQSQSQDIESYKKQTDQRIEKLAKLFLSLSNKIT